MQEGGNHEENPFLKRPQRYITLPGIMAARALREGQKLYWDAATESILDHPPKA